MLDEHTRNKANQSKESKDALMFLKQKVDAAQGFINAVKQRQQTLLSTMQAIIDLQLPFFQDGDERPSPPHDSEGCGRTCQTGYLNSVPRQQQ